VEKERLVELLELAGMKRIGEDDVFYHPTKHCGTIYITSVGVVEVKKVTQGGVETLAMMLSEMVDGDVVSIIENKQPARTRVGELF
jgi:hypothetical protein